MTNIPRFEDLYKILEKIFGPIKAKSSISKIIFIVIHDLIEEGLPITDSNIQERLLIFINDFEEASKDLSI